MVAPKVVGHFVACRTLHGQATSQQINQIPTPAVIVALEPEAAP
jgi:hypothetical protein